MSGPVSRFLFVCLFAQVSCAWVSDAELKARTDEDGDGEPAIAYGGQDCNDRDAAAFPGAKERCNEADDDCDGEVDEGLPLGAYADADGDGYGVGDLLHDDCAGEGEASEAGDCDDDDPDIHPGADEVCGNDIDDDCDPLSSDAGDNTFYRDADDDGYGFANSVASGCAAPVGYVSNPLDCDDANPAVNPEAEEVCDDGLDNDCDGSANGCDDL